MSDIDDKADKADKAKSNKPGPTPIPVRELRFLVPNVPVPIEGAHGGKSRVMAGHIDGGHKFITIHFEPWQRHHRVRVFAGYTGVLVVEFCVPESLCLYEPMEKSSPDKIEVPEYKSDIRY